MDNDKGGLTSGGGGETDDADEMNLEVDSKDD